jgi:hypothetical protein
LAKQGKLKRGETSPDVAARRHKALGLGEPLEIPEFSKRRPGKRLPLGNLTAAIEAACDARAIWSSMTPPLRVIIGGLMDGQTKIDIASDLNLDRFKVARMIKTLQQFAQTG